MFGALGFSTGCSIQGPGSSLMLNSGLWFWLLFTEDAAVSRQGSALRDAPQLHRLLAPSTVWGLGFKVTVQHMKQADISSSVTPSHVPKQN